MTVDRKVVFVRHAKSSWARPSLRDFDRPLNDRGKRDKKLMATKFREEYFVPDLLISSSAKRAHSTAKAFAKVFEKDKNEILLENQLYHASLDEIESVIFEQSVEEHSMMIFGHNPGFTDFANEYSTKYIDNVPTAGIFILEAKTETWIEFLKKCRLTHFIFPKLYV